MNAEQLNSSSILVSDKKTVLLAIHLCYLSSRTKNRDGNPNRRSVLINGIRIWAAPQ